MVPEASCATLNQPTDKNFIGYNTTLVRAVCADLDGPLPALSPFSRYAEGDLAGVRASLHAWCERCVQAVDGAVDATTDASLRNRNAAAMGAFDHASLIICSTLVAFAVVGELKDINLCYLSILRAGDKLSPGWTFALTLLGGVRRWVFLVNMLQTVPFLVTYQGGDAMSVCFNTIAVLFLCEVDNAAFAMVLGERARARVEDAGRIELGDVESAALAQTKVVHVCAITFAICVGVWTVQVTNFAATIVLPRVCMWIGGVAESIVPGETSAETMRRIAKMTGACLLGNAAGVALFLVSLSQ